MHSSGHVPAPGTWPVSCTTVVHNTRHVRKPRTWRVLCMRPSAHGNPPYPAGFSGPVSTWAPAQASSEPLQDSRHVGHFVGAYAASARTVASGSSVVSRRLETIFDTPSLPMLTP